jgi:predicted transcriptional regulator
MKTANRKPPKPSEAELEILHALWNMGPATVRQVHEQLAETKQAQYTTTLKQLQVMAEKGLVDRDESERSHVYRAAVERRLVQRQMASHVLERVFGGSARGMLMEMLGAKRTTKKELAELRQILEDHEKAQKGNRR